MATIKDAHNLLDLVFKSYTSRIEQDLADNVPTDAATLSGAVNLLSKNSITVDPAEQDNLTALRAQLVATAQARRDKNKTTLALVQADMDNVLEA